MSAVGSASKKIGKVAASKLDELITSRSVLEGELAAAKKAGDTEAISEISSQIKMKDMVIKGLGGKVPEVEKVVESGTKKSPDTKTEAATPAAPGPLAELQQKIDPELKTLNTTSESFPGWYSQATDAERQAFRTSGEIPKQYKNWDELVNKPSDIVVRQPEWVNPKYEEGSSVKDVVPVGRPYGTATRVVEEKLNKAGISTDNIREGKKGNALNALITGSGAGIGLAGDTMLFPPGNTKDTPAEPPKKQLVSEEDATPVPEDKKTPGETKKTPTVPKAIGVEKQAPPNAPKRQEAAVSSFEDQYKAIQTARDAAGTDARKRYDEVLSKLDTVRNRIEAFDSRERQILAYERLGDMLGRAFAKLGAGLTAVKQGIEAKPLDLQAVDQSSRYSDLQALSRSRMEGLSDKEKAAASVYQEELRKAEQDRDAALDIAKMQRQDARDIVKEKARREEFQQEMALRWAQLNKQIEQKRTSLSPQQKQDVSVAKAELLNSRNAQQKIVNMFNGIKVDKKKSAEAKKRFKELYPNGSDKDFDTFLETEKDKLLVPLMQVEQGAADRIDSTLGNQPAIRQLVAEQAPKTVRVSNGKEQLEIPIEDLADAQKDGYYEVK
jgi:hypothetical protein